MSGEYFGTCLVGGQHRVGSEAWRECPLRKAAARSERARKGAVARWTRRLGRREHPDGAQGTEPRSDA